MSRLGAALLALALLAGCHDVRTMRVARDVPGLTSALTSSDPQVRIKAADALGHVGDPRAIPPLIKALGDPDPFVREHAARNLGCNHHSTLGCDTSEARSALVDVLDDGDEFVRLEAARSLGDLRDPEARQALERLARGDPQLDVRREALLSLGRLGDPASRPLLEELEADQEPRLQQAASEALRRLATARRRLPLGEAPEPEPQPEAPAADASPSPSSTTQSDAAP